MARLTLFVLQITIFVEFIIFLQVFIADVDIRSNRITQNLDILDIRSLRHIEHCRIFIVVSCNHFIAYIDLVGDGVRRNRCRGDKAAFKCEIQVTAIA